MNWLSVITALESYVAEVETSLPIILPNVKYASTPGIPHLEVDHLPVDTSQIASKVMDTEGILVLGLNYPSGEGSGAAFSKADALSQFFKPGQGIVAGSGNISIIKATLGTKQPSSKADWFVIPLVIHYHAYHNY